MEDPVKIMAAYKPSRPGTAVLRSAVEEARLRRGQLLIVRHVNAGRALTEVAGLGGSPPDRTHSGQSIDKLRQELEALPQQMGLQGVDYETVLLAEGDDAAEQILAMASAAHVNLLVVGVRRRSPVGKAVLGSDAQKIILNADCPVLAVKANDDEG